MASHKILVIDDSKVIRMRVKDMLPEGNFEVLEAKDGVEGMTSIREQRPNLIMLDFLLPRMSGWEVFQEVQANPELQRIPLVLMSGRKEEVTEKITEPFEYFEFIQKPFEQKELIEAIKGAMTKARKPRRPPATSAPAAADAGAGSADEIRVLNAKIESMQAEINTLKKQLSQVVAFVKQKLR